jgi:hypothetical protein
MKSKPIYNGDKDYYERNKWFFCGGGVRMPEEDDPSTLWKPKCNEDELVTKGDKQ